MKYRPKLGQYHPKLGRNRLREDWYDDITRAKTDISYHPTEGITVYPYNIIRAKADIVLVGSWRADITLEGRGRGDSTRTDILLERADTTLEGTNILISYYY